MPDMRANAEAKNISNLFAGKIFRVPDYQRNYAWIERNWEDFWNDIKDGLLTNTEHYLGTIALRKTKEATYLDEKATEFRVYDIVDGQQRIATAFLFLLALSNLGEKAIRETYVKSGDFYRLELGSLNNSYLRSLVDGADIPADIKSNRLLKGALGYFESQIRTFGRAKELSKYILSRIVCLEFTVEEEITAIKAFESLNDRGRPLTLLDKMKSFLMFYSSQYLDGRLNPPTNSAFGRIFSSFDLIKELGEKEEIQYLRSERFTEDEVLRFFYHYFAFYATTKFGLPNAYDYRISLEDVFTIFLKEACGHLRNSPDQLSDFLEELLHGLNKVVSALERVIQRSTNELRYKKLFSFLGVDATVYPLIVSLEAEKLLNDDLLAAVESLNLKVYRLANSASRVALYRNTVIQIKEGLKPTQAFENIRNYISSNMSDTALEGLLTRAIYGEDAVKYILWEYEKYQNPSFNDGDFDLYKDVTIEHIFPQTETEFFSGEEFQSMDEYLENLNRLGNLTLLEQRLNSQAGNNIPKNKAKFYRRSNLPRTKKLGSMIDVHGFAKHDIDSITKEIASFCLSRWRLSGHGPP